MRTHRMPKSWHTQGNALPSCGSCKQASFSSCLWCPGFCIFVTSLFLWSLMAVLKGCLGFLSTGRLWGAWWRKYMCSASSSQAWGTLLLAVGTLFMNQQYVPHKMPLNGGKRVLPTKSESRHIPWMPRPASSFLQARHGVSLHRGTWTKAESQVYWLEGKSVKTVPAGYGARTHQGDDGGASSGTGHDEQVIGHVELGENRAPRWAFCGGVMASYILGALPLPL